MQDWAKVVYNSGTWRYKIRPAFIKERRAIDGGLCQECHERLGYIVHHTVLLTPENVNDPEIVYNFRLLRFVCKECHDKYDGHGVGGPALTPTIRFDANGDPIPP